jgi:hypothetical protein
MRDEVAGRCEDVAGGSVIPFEADHDGAGEILLEAQDVVDLGTAPVIDRLFVIAYAVDVVLGSLRLLCLSLFP